MSVNLQDFDAEDPAQAPEPPRTPISKPGPDLQSPARHREAADDDVTRSLPHAVGPEKSLLSSMLKDPQQFVPLAVEHGLTAEHFYLPANATLFGFLLDLFNAGVEIELVSLVQRLLDRGEIDRVGGPATLADLYNYSPYDGYFMHHLELVREKYVMRSLIQLSNETIASAYDSPDESAELLDRTEAKIMAIREGGARAAEPSNKIVVEDVLEDLQALIEGRNEVCGISTGYNGLDNKGARLKPGEMFVIAARPSMGKTSFMMNIVENVCIENDLYGLVFSAEMTRKAVIERLVYSRAKISKRKIEDGYKPNKGDLQRIQKAALDVVASHLSFDDSSGITIGEIRAKARRKHRENPLSLIAIDYLQLLKSTSRQAMNSREREISEISAGIKGLAKDLGVPIILLAQLNRGPEGRTGKNLGVPRMSDLRESGSIEQDADMVGLLYREDYYAEDKEACAGRAKLILDKNRNGPTGDVPLTFIADLMRYEDGPPAYEQPEFQPPIKSRYDD